MFGLLHLSAAINLGKLAKKGSNIAMTSPMVPAQAKLGGAGVIGYITSVALTVSRVSNLLNLL